MRSSSRLAPIVLCLAATLLAAPAFLPGALPRAPAVDSRSQANLALSFGAAATAYGAPLAASADDGLPTPVLGIGMLSVVVVIVLIVSGIVIARGLLDDETGGEL
eukprot:TRINITY_DN109695_c0_g1_i1.p2 TRINITY_DN109695_c0_g1~~TRINITY_DN109695_c0_g1_i1.p2  ORF type:complete len:105 (-),score=11.41 TRINITY_DN109695_c0_g1_i1:146-460(-)